MIYSHAAENWFPEGKQKILPGLMGESVVTGLRPWAVYHLRVFAENQLGKSKEGKVLQVGGWVIKLQQYRERVRIEVQPRLVPDEMVSGLLERNCTIINVSIVLTAGPFQPTVCDERRETRRSPSQRPHHRPVLVQPRGHVGRPRAHPPSRPYRPLQHWL